MNGLWLVGVDTVVTKVAKGTENPGGWLRECLEIPAKLAILKIRVNKAARVEMG